MRKFEIREPVIFENQGQKIFGVYHRPVGTLKGPAVLMCHGFAGTKSGRFRACVSLSEKLAEYGIASLRFDFRGSGDSEGTISEMTIESEVSDAHLAMIHLLKMPEVDPTRIGCFGRSLGGVITLLNAKDFPQVKSLALWAPTFNALQWQEKLVSGGLHLALESSKGDELVPFAGNIINMNFLRQFFCLKLENELAHFDSSPLLHIHGEKDNVVSIAHADLYDKARKQAQATTKMIRYPNSDHEFSDPHERFLAIEETARWFEITL